MKTQTDSGISVEKSVIVSDDLRPRCHFGGDFSPPDNCSGLLVGLTSA